MKTLSPYIYLFIFSAFIIGCNTYGKEKTFNGVQLYYTDKVTEAEADALGNYLVTAEFADGEEKTVQLNKTGNTYEFRMVIKEGIDKDPEFIEIGKVFAGELSANVFNGNQVDVHFCDEQLNTIIVLPMRVN